MSAMLAPRAEPARATRTEGMARGRSAYLFLQNLQVEMHVPASWVGKSLIELDLRGRYGINVIAIKEGENVTIEMNPSEPLRSGQTLGIVGKNEILSRLSESNYQD